MYEEMGQRLGSVAAEAEWQASTDVTAEHTGERIGAERALAGFRGSRYVIENSRRFLGLKQSLSDLEFRQLDKILLNAAESPATIPDIVRARIETEARLGATLDSYTFCLASRGKKCVSEITPNQIDKTLVASRDLGERRKVWEVSKEIGPALKKDLGEARDLRNRVATELGYSSYFDLQVADYGLSVAEMMQLMDKMVADVEPLYRQLHRVCPPAAGGAVPATGSRTNCPRTGCPTAGDRIGPAWRRAWRWTTCSAASLPSGSSSRPSASTRLWDGPRCRAASGRRSDLYQLPADSTRKKNTHASAWHIDSDQDVRSLMNVVPNFRWFETSHHELGHIYYYLAYSNPRVPVVLREGANRAFHEAVGDLIGIASRQEPYLRQAGLLPASRKIDPAEWLLNEALSNAVVFVPFSAGTMTHFEYDLYEKKLPVGEFNQRWWELASRYQRIAPPAARGEEYCDACTKTHIIDDPAQYYDYALACLLKFQLHDHIARKILQQDPHNCNYYGNKEVGKWLWDILSLGATRDWRQVIREKTGEDLSSRAMLEYFRPLKEYLDKQNATRP